MIEERYVVVCDRCNDETRAYASEESVIELALECGWKVGKWHSEPIYLCDDCIEQHGLPSWWPEATGAVLIWR